MAEIFQNAKKWTADLCQILRMVTIEIVFNSTHITGIRVTIEELHDTRFLGGSIFHGAIFGV